MTDADRGLVTTAALLASGKTYAMIYGARDRGELHLVCRGLFIRGRTSLDRESTMLAAVLATGGDAMLTQLAALELQGYSRFTADVITVAATKQRTCPFDNISPKRTKAAIAGHRTTIRDIPVTSPEWTITDLGVVLDEYQVANVIYQSQFRGIAIWLRSVVSSRRTRTGQGTRSCDGDSRCTTQGVRELAAHSRTPSSSWSDEQQSRCRS